jgi:hypothetical protein
LWLATRNSFVVAAVSVAFYAHCGNIVRSGGELAGSCSSWLTPRRAATNAIFWLEARLQRSRAQAHVMFVAPVFSLWLTLVAIFVINYMMHNYEHEWQVSPPLDLHTHIPASPSREAWRSL